MTTLYVHPAESSSEQDYELNQRHYERNHHSSKNEKFDHHDHHLHYRSPRHLNQHQHQSHYHQYNNNNGNGNGAGNDLSPNSLSSVQSVQSIQSSSSSIPPPTLFFPVDDEYMEQNKNNIKTSANTNTNININQNNTNNNNNNNTKLQSLPVTNLSNLPALPPLSALTSNDGELLLNIKDLSRLKKLSVGEIKKELNCQRLKNETLLAKLHNDQKKFVKVCKHYEKKNTKLQGDVVAVAKKNKTSVQSVKVMRSLLVEHKCEVDKNQQEHFQCQISKSALWKGVATNMQLLSEVNALNKQIDAYHLLIAKKNQEKIVNIDDQKDKEEINLIKQPSQQQNSNCNLIVDDDSKEVETTPTIQRQQQQQPQQQHTPINAMSMAPNSMTQNIQDPTANYAQQLIARNKRYHEILALLREKVDELRACRKKL